MSLQKGNVVTSLDSVWKMELPTKAHDHMSNMDAADPVRRRQSCSNVALSATRRDHVAKMAVDPRWRRQTCRKMALPVTGWDHVANMLVDSSGRKESCTKASIFFAYFLWVLCFYENDLCLSHVCVSLTISSTRRTMDIHCKQCTVGTTGRNCPPPSPAE